ncbi:DUF4292 domain-containing protein [Flavobacterium buctense]|uniref:DUF4292 domain-containing protein n=1 Tax=Flavobacterium buctense TaxID=1648146 RepID=A0ABU9DXD9_9FLAO|nr:DUF4292 domain-containing protein [Flavobacterium buctense]
MKYWYFILSVVFLTSCKSKAVLVDSNSKPTVTIDENAISSQKIIKNHYNNKSDFSTLYIRSSAKYRDEKQSQNVTAEIKIKKGEKILVSIRFLGITMAKALITPNEVKYYEKINGTYFEGDYASLSEWLGTDLDFDKIQNMLVGKPIDDLTQQDYAYELTDKFYKLSTVKDKTEKAFSFESKNFLLKKQEITQPEKDRTFTVNYPNFQDFASAILPANLQINAMQKKGKTEISIDYNSVTFNEDLSFPYSVPDGYDRIFIN